MDLDQEVPLDIESYATNFVSHAKVDRLLFIAEKSAGTSLELEALRIAADELKKGENTQKYADVIERICGRLGPSYAGDREWMEQVERKASSKQDRLEADLNGYKTNLIKESIRMGHDELGEFFYGRGDLVNSFKSFVRTRDYCSTSKHVLSMCLNVIKVSVELKNWVHVNNYVQKAEQTPDIQKDTVANGKLLCAAGLAALESKKYRIAAQKFTEVSSELGTLYSDVIAPQEVATYGALCALATFSRTELRSNVLENIHFREFLELLPEVREAVNDFYGSRYASCLSHLERLKPLLRLDLHLHTHVEALYAAVRNKALVQYAAPFLSVNLTTMAEAFKTSLSGLEQELADLITSQQIQARIDSHNKVLYARHTHTRNATFKDAVDAGEQYLRDAKALLLRASLLQHDVVQRQPPAAANRHGNRPLVGVDRGI